MDSVTRVEISAHLAHAFSSAVSYLTYYIYIQSPLTKLICAQLASSNEFCFLDISFQELHKTVSVLHGWNYGDSYYAPRWARKINCHTWRSQQKKKSVCNFFFLMWNNLKNSRH